MSNETEDHHGNSPASWTTVIIMLVAFTIGTFAFWFDLPVIVWAAAGLCLLGPIVGLFLKRAGYGVGGDKVIPKAHS
ncbi:hypothetical protein EYE40_04585 [Glaciihabitans arcticus]|uniref:DUF4175 domain-containing protein n=1 Tax=Glaciihabitans arcticus TaxID=2668039 RepID=A0A4Q9GVP1_9MICO|nr:DUF6704 family protein [Glaciihabitans arcticus]TBN56733.1 hypothetical protein EYE40_04585 [Glaciihabitans arcticus]